MSNQKFLLSMAVLSVLALTTVGCGKSKETRSDVRGGGQADSQTLEDTLGSDEQSNDGLVKSEDGPKPLPKSGDSTDLGEHNDATNETKPLIPSGSNQNGSNQQGAKPKTESRAVLAKFNEAEAVKTGGKSSDANFTSAGDDGLMEKFRSYNKTVNADQQTMNTNLAKAITSAKLKRQTGGEMTVDLSLDESINGVKKLSIYKLTAKAESNRFILKQVSNSNGDLEYQGGFLKCIDKDGGCNTAYIKIKMSGAYARIIFRNSVADRFFVTQQGASSQAFDLLKTYLINTVNFENTTQKISTAQVSSFEVVNGRSAMGAMILADDKEMIGLSIPLFARDTGTEISSQVSKSSDLSKAYDLVTPAGSTQRIASGIKDVKLINNNGKGDVRLLLDLSGSTQAVMWLTLSAIPKATLSIAEIEGFEAKVPKF
jgi:hypothetical protein